MNNESGFTLIEVVVSLVLVGMMAAIAGMGIVTGTKGYLLAKENSHMAQKAQMAMARIQRELMELTNIAEADPAFIIYDNTTGRHAIARDGTDVKMYHLAEGVMILPLDGDILVDNVNNFTLDYFQGTSDWGGADIQRLSTIQADLALDRSDGSGHTVIFTTTVNPRNTNNYGGVPPAATPGTAHNYSCFVATATYGEASFLKVYLIGFLIVALVLIRYCLRHSQPPCFPASQPQSLPTVFPVLRQDKGNVLIGLIVTLMIFAALGAGMVAMTGTSTFSQVTANTTSKAYYLAESGFRYAASVYLNEGDTDGDGEIEDDRNQRLIGLHDSPFTLSDHDGRFNLQVYPYYFITTHFRPTGSLNIRTDFAGEAPADFSMPPAGGRIRIGTRIYTYTNYSVGTGFFTLAAPGLLEPVSVNMTVTPVGQPSAGGTMTNEGDLTLLSTTFFPAITGKFMIDGIVYTYQTKNGNTLQHITDANDPDRVFSISVDSNTNVVLKPYLRIFSIGTFGQGDQAASREIIYNVPIPDHPTEGEKVEFRDEFVDTSHWKASTWGSHAAQDVSGDSALKVTGTTSEGSVEKSLKGLDWESTNINLAYVHSVSGNFLSYDTQVKVGFDPATVPDHPSADYAAGLSFRLDQNNNSYGVSFMQSDSDAIDPNIVPSVPDGIPMIVLWQQTGSGLTRNWLAYTFGVNEFSDDMESGTGGWTADIPWAHTVADSHSPTTCWTDSPGNYIAGTDPSLITPSVDLSGVPSAVLTFWHKFDFELNDDYGRVEVSTNNWITSNLLHEYTGSNGWEKVVIDISSYLNPNVQIRFRADATGISPVTDDGWYIDDVTIHRGFPVNDSTLLVRIKEGATVEFDNGGPTAVEDGDTLTQASGARGIVVGEPIIDDSGDWATNNAQGIIILNKLSGPVFQSGQPLIVPGKGGVAGCTGYHSRDNYIKVFYGYDVGTGANNDPFDDLKRDNMRNEPYLHWPPDDLEGVLWPPGPGGDPTAYDYFTLVKWHEVVDSLVVPSVEIVPSKYESNAIIRSWESDLLTPDSYLSHLRPELGLHTFGSDSTHVYFDDFGLLVEIAAGTGFLTPIQE